MQVRLPKEERYWTKAILQTQVAVEYNSLVPLNTITLKKFHINEYTFEIRRLISKIPPQLSNSNSKNNPFSPWDPLLEIDNISDYHVLILNKYPVQLGHMLLITKEWQPQNGWLNIDDWKALELVEKDTSGLWFFNSSPEAGASQPHRHIQLLRRHSSESICPREQWFDDYLDDRIDKNCLLARNAKVLRRDLYNPSSDNLSNIYVKLCSSMGLGDPLVDDRPKKAYNLLITSDWVAIILRCRESINGFNINALGFAGYLLATDSSDMNYLDSYGPNYLLENVIGSN